MLKLHFMCLTLWWIFEYSLLPSWVLHINFKEIFTSLIPWWLLQNSSAFMCTSMYLFIYLHTLHWLGTIACSRNQCFLYIWQFYNVMIYNSYCMRFCPKPLSRNICCTFILSSILKMFVSILIFSFLFFLFFQWLNGFIVDYNNIR